jgi:hypothetical protein
MTNGGTDTCTGMSTTIRSPHRCSMTARLLLAAD